eukprot:TRINITY_DN7829_c0_g1_i1.p1 TRINITY_DN7829_c0_g1~~TRINITY_DN7829_c0_g1_i1.p1  ORF type:complete len:265 (+),score=52.30 TRINITY_DN7829_c0_g1_i1:81-875(+)
MARVFGLGSYFCLPEQGMTSFDVLSRGSLSIIKAAPSSPVKYHLVSAAHIAYPFKFPRLYPTDQPHLEWLTFVGEKDTQLKFQVRSESGDISLEIPIASTTRMAPNGLDLIAMQFEDEAAAEASLASHGISLSESAATLHSEQLMNPVAPDPSIKLNLVGHDLLKNEFGLEVMKPITLAGELNFATRQKYFAKTATPSTMGLCGGPAIDGANRVVGIVEARVESNTRQLEALKEDPEKHRALVAILDNTVIIPSTVISAFLGEE